jgi:hypothetical protein
MLCNNCFALKSQGPYIMHAPIIAPLLPRHDVDLDAQAIAAKMEQRRRELCRELEEIRKERAIKQRRKIYRESRLTPFRRDLLLLRADGASYANIALWLKRNKKITVAPTTVMRYLAGLSQFRKESAEDSDKR